MKVLFDTSALYKRYNQEAGSEQVREITARTRELVVAAHCKTEIASAINRQRHDGLVAQDEYTRIMSAVHEDFSAFSRLDLDGRVEAFAIAAMERSRLRAVDALHIATAQASRVDLFVTADRRQAAAAQAAGLHIELVQA